MAAFDPLQTFEWARRFAELSSARGGWNCSDRGRRQL